MAVDGPRIAQSNEFSMIEELVDKAFHREQGGMVARIPYCYDDQHPERHAIILDNEKIVAHAAAIPQTLSIGESEIDCYGIGGVTTDPRYRGEGYMSKLIEFWLDTVDAPLFELGGDRQRYGHFGWENAGREFEFRITPRSLSRGDTSQSVRRYEGQLHGLETLQQIHSDEPYRVCRNRRRSEQVFGQRGVETILTTDGESAYLCFTRESRQSTVVEFGGDVSKVRLLLAHVFDCYDIETLIVKSPPSHQLNPLFRSVSSSWTVLPLRKMNVRDLPTSLKAFVPQIERKLQLAGIGPETVSIGIQGEASVRLQYTDRLSVEQVDTVPDIAVDRRTMTTLLFGLPDQTVDSRHQSPILTIGLPLSFYIWRSERV